jgi:DNA-binding NarL/FixJ family response regulator
MRQHKVLIISSHEFGWGDLRTTLQSMEGVCLVGETTTIRLAINLATLCRPDVIISAAILEENSALPHLIELRCNLPPATKFIIFTSRIIPTDFLALEVLGIAGYVLWSDLSLEVLPHCLAAMISGEIVLGSQTVVKALSNAWSRSPRRSDGPMHLSERERNVLQRLAEGLTHEQIARVEPLSLRTVERSVAALEARLDAPNQFVLGLKAAQLGLLG